MTRLPPAERHRDDRGTNPSGEPDAHADGNHALPPFDPDYRVSDTNDRIDRTVRDDRPLHRTDTLFPYLYVRAVPGDRGARPLYPAVLFWESCDIHLVPVGSGAFDFADTVLQPVAGQSYRVFVHVWNLGRLAAYGARLKVWWVEPGFFMSSDPQYNPNFIGGAYFDLGDRDSAEAHRLIEVPTPWTVVMNHDAHECLMVAVECATDPWDRTLNANTHRHVAQRNLNLLSGSDNLAPLVSRLGAAVSPRATELLIEHAGVGRADFAGAHEHGLARTAEAPDGWNHSGLAFVRDDAPLAAVRRSREGLRFFNLRSPGRVPPGGGRFPPAGASAGVPVRELRRDLPRLLQQAVGTPDFTARSVATALGGRGGARLLRFSTRDAEGRIGGYSIVVAP